jgi:molybdenum cofactor guanylyltransferase
MKHDKALLEIDGWPLWQRQRDVLAELGATEIFLSARPDQEWVKGATGFKAVLHDANPGCGPLSGIIAALERTAASHLVVLAIDLPRITSDWLDSMLTQRKPGVGVVARFGEFFEPLAAVYPREFMPLAWEGMASGRYALQPLLAQGVNDGLFTVGDLTEREAPLYENWNEPIAS